MENAAKVPITVAKEEEITARSSEFFSAASASPSRNSSLYQRRENPVNSLKLPEELKENRITTRMGAYRMKKMIAM